MKLAIKMKNAESLPARKRQGRGKEGKKRQELKSQKNEKRGS